jgi:hypothetical protein
LQRFYQSIFCGSDFAQAATVIANGLALGAVAAKADLSTFGKIIILREKSLDLPENQ